MRAAAAPLALALLLSGCTSSPKPDIVLILIDTLRRDHVGAYGGGELTPFIDSLAARGHLFRDTRSQSSWTNPSVASLLTSRYQSQHRVTWFDSVLAADEVTLPEVLKQHGYATGGFAANPLVQGKSGYDQGFDVYRTYARTQTGALGEPISIKERGEKINQESLAWLDTVLQGSKPRPPVFLYVHYMEPHNPFDPADAVLDSVLAGRPRPDRSRVNDHMALSNVVEFDDELLQGVRDLYRAEVLSVDARIRELFDALQARGFLEHVVVAVTADHGEEFMEHGRVGHDRTLYEEVIRVPLILLTPGQKEHVEIARPTMLTDVAPTLLALARVGAPASFEGENLGPLLGGKGATPKRERAVFSQLIRSRDSVGVSPHEHVIVRGGHKLIRGAGGEREFYDLGPDPGEHKADALDAGERAALSSELQSFLDEIGQRAAPGAVRTLDPETRERMRALGYED